jgi:hypothetical protein
MSAERLRDAVAVLVDAVDDGQRGELCLPFDEAERRTWFYWPAERRGLPLSRMDARQRKLAHVAVRALLSVPAYARVATIIGLEEVLEELEARGERGRRRIEGLPRDSSAYATTVFGDVDGAGPWGWRFEGHHVSLHATVLDGELAATPLFLGANPASLRHRDRTVLRPFGEEEDLARQLLGALPAAHRRRAVIDDKAPDDIVTANAPLVEDDLAKEGVPVQDLTGEAAALSEALVRCYTERIEPAHEAEVGDVRFAWAGSPEPGSGHYYRLAGARFLVEYDNTQNHADHAHSVWRDPGGDFGDDLLRRHRSRDHQDRQ